MAPFRKESKHGLGKDAFVNYAVNCKQYGFAISSFFSSFLLAEEYEQLVISSKTVNKRFIIIIIIIIINLMIAMAQICSMVHIAILKMFSNPSVLNRKRD